MNITISNNSDKHVTSYQDITTHLLFNENNQVLDENVDSLIDLWKYVKQLKLTDDYKKQKKDSQCDNNSTKINSKLRFSIVKLPDDLITNISFFLDKK